MLPRLIAGSARLVASAALALTALPGVVQAGFSEPLVPVSEVFGASGGQSLAVNPAGDSIITWATSPNPMTKRTVKARRLKTDGTLGPVLTLSDGTQVASEPKVAFAGNGRAVVVWAERTAPVPESSLMARVIEPDDSMGAIRPVRNASANSDSGEPSISATSVDDTVLVAWHNFTSTPGPFRRVEARHMKTDGTLNAILVPDSTAGATFVRGAADAVGGTLLVWKQGPAIRAQNITAADTKGTLRTPESDGHSAPALAGDGQGNFNLLYGNSAAGAQYSLDFRPLAPDGSPAPERNIDPLGSAFVGRGHLAMNSATRSLVAWTRGGTAKARFIDGEQDPEPETFSASDPDGAQEVTGVGIGGSGAGAISFQRQTPSSETSTWGRIIPAAGAAPAPVRLSPAGQHTSSAGLAIAASDAGLVTWTANDSGSFQLFARQILPPPTCTDTAGTIDDGRPTAVALPCTGLQLRAADVVGQPAHGTLAAPDGPSQSVVYTPQPGYEGPDAFTWRGRNAGGPADATRTATLTVHKAPAGPGGAGGGGARPADVLAPRVNRFTVSPKKIRLTGRKRTRKTTLRLGFSEPATVVVTIERKRPCLRRRPRCNKFPRFGTLASKRPARLAAALSFTRKIGRKKLTPGTYRASAVATDQARNRSKVRRVSFKVLRRQ